MKIAVTYENGQIFQHFGHTEQFKLYEAADGKVTHAEVVDTNGSGHGALAGKWTFPALPCRRFTKSHGARSQRALSTENRCTSQGETTASAEDRRQPTAAAAAGRREPTQKNPTKIAKENPL